MSTTMKLATAITVAGAITLGAQTDKGPAAVAAHKAAAERAAGADFKALKTSACAEREPAPAAAAAGRGAAATTTGAAARGAAQPAAAARTTPPREQWITEPMKVFDNMYFVGTKEHGAWAITTSAGIIVIDALYDYAVIDAVEGGMKKLGLDPAQMKYLVITHGHGDHHGGAKYLQDKYRPRVIMGPKDWDLVLRDARNPRPTRDMDATDGQKLTLGDTTITLYLTPGHTPSTISTLVPVKDNGVPHMAAEWGGTAINATTAVESVQQYVASATRFRKIAADAGADAVFTNHTNFDGTLTKLAAIGTRRSGQPNPYVIGRAAADRYMTVVEECGKAMLAGR